MDLAYRFEWLECVLKILTSLQNYGSKPVERTGAVQKTSSFYSCSRKTFSIFWIIIILIKEEESKARTWRIIGLQTEFWLVKLTLGLSSFYFFRKLFSHGKFIFPVQHLYLLVDTCSSIRECDDKRIYCS